LPPEMYMDIFPAAGLEVGATKAPLTLVCKTIFPVPEIIYSAVSPNPLQAAWP
jgi:hypothetical protein